MSIDKQIERKKHLTARDIADLSVESITPALRGSFARDVLSEYRRWVLQQIATAGSTEYLREMEELKERLAKEFDLVIRGDEGAIKRCLTEYRELL